MRNLSIKIAVTVLTFLAGCVIASVYNRVAHPLSVKDGSSVSVVPRESSPILGLKTEAEGGSLPHLECLRFIMDEGRLFAEFRFTNTDSETIYYMAYSKGTTPIYKRMVKRGAWSRPMSWTFCATGLEGFPLSENESITFRVPVSDGDEALKVGIRLVKKKGLNPMEVWSEEIAVSKSPGRAV